MISKKIIGLEQGIRSGWPIPWMGTLYFGPPCMKTSENIAGNGHTRRGAEWARARIAKLLLLTVRSCSQLGSVEK